MKKLLASLILVSFLFSSLSIRGVNANFTIVSVTVDTSKSTLYPGGELYYIASFTNDIGGDQARITSLNFTQDSFGVIYLFPNPPIVVNPGQTLNEEVHFTIASSIAPGTYQATIKAAIEFLVNGVWTPANPPIINQPLSVTVTSAPAQGSLSFDSVTIDSTSSTLYPGGTLYYVATFTNSGSLQARITSLVLATETYSCSLSSPYVPIAVDIGKTLPVTVTCPIPSSSSVKTYNATVTATIEFFNNGQWLPASPPTIASQLLLTLTAQNGLIGQYWGGSSLQSNPPNHTEIDPNISYATLYGYNWHPFNYGSFSVRWNGIITTPLSGTYSFELNSDDASWLYIDDALIINNGGPHPPGTMEGSLSLTKGQHSIGVVFVECCGGQSGIDLSWMPPGATSFTLVPSAAFTIATGASLSIQISFAPRGPRIGQLVTFNAVVSGGSPPYGVAWNFGDGSPISYGFSTTHVFSNPGTFEVRAGVADSSTPTNTAVTSILVAVSGGQDFTVRAIPSSLNISQGSCASSVVTLASVNGFYGTVYLSSFTRDPDIRSLDLNPMSVSLTSDGLVSATLTACSFNSATSASYTITVTGTSGLISHSAVIDVTVTGSTPPPSSSSSLQQLLLQQQESSFGQSVFLTSLNEGLIGPVASLNQWSIIEPLGPGQ